MGWRGFVDKERKLVFFWSQKAACTSLFHFLSQNSANPPEEKKFYLANSLHTDACLKLIRKRKFQSVIVARHPATRIVSAFLNKFCVYYGRPLRHHARLEVFAQALHLDICAAAGREPEENRTTFEEFLGAIERLHAARPDPAKRLNGHWDTQVPASLVASGFQYDRVMRVETLHDDMTRFAAEQGMVWDGTAHNTTRYSGADASGGYLGDVPVSELWGTPFGTANFLGDRAIERVARVYAPDFAMFGYPACPAELVVS